MTAKLPEYERAMKNLMGRIAITDGCWLWTGPLNPKGYGVMAALGETIAHRVSYVLHCGAIPEGKMILHHCDVKNCVFPGHLYAGTHRDNVRDAIERHRYNSPRGEKASCVKLTEKEVKEIRLKYKMGGIMQKELAKEYGMSNSEVGLIINFKKWAWLR